jgi:hypothetical protein
VLKRGRKKVDEVGGASRTRKGQTVGDDGDARIRREVGKRAKMWRTDL